MQFNENAEVLSAKREKIGKIDRVVIDPVSMEVTHLVVKEGILFSRMKVLPVDRIEKTTDERVILAKSAGDPDKWPDFEEKHHVPADDMGPYPNLPAGSARPFVWYHLHKGHPWWRIGDYPGYSAPSFTTRIERNIPDNAIPLEEGATVVSKDDETLGNVERIFVEPEENRAAHLLVSGGLLSKEKKLIPTHWVDSVSEKTVRLAVEKKLIDKLPEFQDIS
jgi:uncharacterized protein YrrD